MGGEPPTRAAAQERAARIRAFRAELAELEREGVLQLAPEQREALHQHHERLLQELRARFDVDITETEHQMSRGMRLASAFGALALAAALFFFFWRIWGLISTPVQVGILIVVPLAALLGMELTRRVERTLYLTGLLGLLAVATFVLNLSMLGRIFNIAPSPESFLAWAAFSIVLAYGYGLRPLLAVGVVFFVAYVTVTPGRWWGCSWLELATRAENYLLAGAVVFAVPLVARHRRREGFASVYRVVGSLVGFGALWFLGTWGLGSYLPWPSEAVEILYQLVAFLAGGLAIWIGLRAGWRDTVRVGTAFFVIFLYTKFVDWWWAWMPKYVFFLILGLVSLVLLLILRRARERLRGST